MGKIGTIMENVGLMYQYVSNSFGLLQGSIMPSGNTFFMQTAVAEQQLSARLISRA